MIVTVCILSHKCQFFTRTFECLTGPGVFENKSHNVAMYVIVDFPVTFLRKLLATLRAPECLSSSAKRPYFTEVFLVVCLIIYIFFFKLSQSADDASRNQRRNLIYKKHFRSLRGDLGYWTCTWKKGVCCDYPPKLFLAHFPKAGLCDLPPPPPVKFSMQEPIFTKLGMYREDL
jgi:hypothetical protein